MPAENVKPMVDATFSMLRDSTCGKDEAAGSCVVIYAEKGEPLVCLTALHVVMELMESSRDTLRIFNIIDGNTYSRTARFLQAAPASDLALLATIDDWDGPSIAPRILLKEPLQGMSVYAIGAPHGIHNLITKGIISGKVLCEENSYCYKIDAVMIHGNSGGPIFTESGVLIGIARMVEMDSQPLLAINGTEIGQPRFESGMTAFVNQIRPGGYLISTIPELILFLNEVRRTNERTEKED